MKRLPRIAFIFCIIEKLPHFPPKPHFMSIRTNCWLLECELFLYCMHSIYAYNSTELRFFDPLYVVVFFSSQSYLRCVYAKCFSATTANYRGWHATNTLNIECQWRGKRHVMAGRLLLIKIIRTEYWRRRRIVFFARWCALNWIKSQKF